MLPTSLSEILRKEKILGYLIKVETNFYKLIFIENVLKQIRLEKVLYNLAEQSKIKSYN